MKTIVDIYFRLLKHALVVSLAAMVILVFGNVVLRYGLNKGIPVAEELSRWLLVWLVFLGSITGMRERAHIGFDSLVAWLPLPGKQACFVASHLLMLGTMWLLLVGLCAQVQVNAATLAPATGLSMSVLYASGIPFAVSVGAIVLSNLLRLWRGTLSTEELTGVSESEELHHTPAAAAGTRA
ncbi:MAG TPA: TRAP transporter small permease [Ramlibacter sp.]|nr:TRAP transporter small permease [Ramlibacter sp.]